MSNPPSMYASLLLPELREAISAGNTEELREFCNALHPAVVAEIIAELDEPQAWKVLTACPIELRVDIFEFLSITQQEELALKSDRKKLSRLIEEMAPDDRVDLLSRLPDEQVEKLLPLLAQAERSDIRKLLSYEEGSAGSLMTTEYAHLADDVTVKDALDKLRQQAPNRETIYYIYVVDDARRLKGIVSLRELILASPKAKIGEIMSRDIISVKVDDDQEEVAQLMAKYDFIAVPVVDEQQHLVGIITHDDVLDVIHEEASEDAYRQGAVMPLEDGYLETPIHVIAYKRGVWLMFLSIVALGTAQVLQVYSGVATVHAWMILFLPMVLASGGNAGSQSATLIIRTIALGEAGSSRAAAILGRELLVGLALGFVMASIEFVASHFWFHLSLKQSLVVGATIQLVVIMGTVTGGALPLIFQKFGMDPALMSNPLISALVDVLGVVIYFTVALTLLGAVEAAG